MAFQAAAAITALYAAYRWHRVYAFGPPDFGVTATWAASAEWVVPVGRWATTSAALNRRAAWWTSCATVLAALSLLAAMAE
jgi:hypothetical protein